MPKIPAPEKPSSKVVAKRSSQPTKNIANPATPNAQPKSVKRQSTASKDTATKALKEITKPKKAKVIRDSFTMPESEYELIAAIKKRCIAKGLAVKKSEVLRAAVVVFAAQSDNSIKTALGSLEVIKTGRPLKGKK